MVHIYILEKFVGSFYFNFISRIVVINNNNKKNHTNHKYGMCLYCTPNSNVYFICFLNKIKLFIRNINKITQTQ